MPQDEVVNSLPHAHRVTEIMKLFVSNFSFSRSSIISSPVLPAAFLELLAATAGARVVTPDVLEHLLPFSFRRSLFSRLNRGTDFITEFLRQFFK